MKQAKISMRVCVGLLAGAGILFAAEHFYATKAAESSKMEAPQFEVDPTWPHIPNGWTLGQVGSVASDAKDNIWVFQRPKTVRPDQKAAPPVMEFDQAGNYIKGWGGPSPDYSWPQTEHGIFVDYKGFVWITGSGNDDQILKFTQDGKFVMALGKGPSKRTNADTTSFWKPADIFIYQKTNEAFVADGYGNKRIIVFDADTGAFKRMWGAYGKPPVDGVSSPEGAARPRPNPNRIPARELADDDPNPMQFDTVHGVKVSNDGMVYVADRGGRRVQVFAIDGKYISQIWVDRWCEEIGQACGNGQTVASVAFSADPGQRFLYVASRSPARIWVYDRKSLQALYYFGSPGIGPGQFYALHHMTTDSAGNLYTSEVEDGKRVQKFVFKGLAPVPAKSNMVQMRVN